MAITKNKRASTLKVVNKRKPMSKEGKRKAILHMTSEIFGNDLIKTHLSDNPDLIKLLESVDFKYANFIEAKVKEVVEKHSGENFATEQDFLFYMEMNCEVRRNEDPNPLNVLYCKQVQLCTWRDSPEVIERATADHSITEQ